MKSYVALLVGLAMLGGGVTLTALGITAEIGIPLGIAGIALLAHGF